MADSIHVKLPDGSVKEVPKGTTALEIAKSISPGLADAALAAKANGDLIDLTRPLEKDTDLRLLKDQRAAAKKKQENFSIGFGNISLERFVPGSYTLWLKRGAERIMIWTTRKRF